MAPCFFAWTLMAAAVERQHESSPLILCQLPPLYALQRVYIGVKEPVDEIGCRKCYSKSKGRQL